MKKPIEALTEIRSDLFERIDQLAGFPQVGPLARQNLLKAIEEIGTAQARIINESYETDKQN